MNLLPAAIVRRHGVAGALQRLTSGFLLGDPDLEVLRRGSQLFLGLFRFSKKPRCLTGQATHFRHPLLGAVHEVLRVIWHVLSVGDPFAYAIGLLTRLHAVTAGFVKLPQPSLTT